MNVERKFSVSQTQAFVCLTVAFLLTSSSALAAGSATPSAVKPDDKAVIVCVQEPPPTGSRLGAHTICHTKAEWDALHATTRDLLDSTSHKALEFNPQGH